MRTTCRKDYAFLKATKNLSLKDVSRYTLIAVFLLMFASGCEKYGIKSDSGTTPQSEISIMNVAPADLEDSVEVNPVILISFADGVNLSNFSASNFSLKKGTSEVPGEVSFLGSLAAFVPEVELTGETEYTATVKMPSMGMNGAMEEKRFTWKFKTGNKRHDYSNCVLSVSPQDETHNVPLNTTLTVTFQKELSPVLQSITTVSLKKGSTPVTGTMSFSGATATFTPSAPLAPGTEYYARVIFGAGNNYFNNDKSRNYYSWNFTTVPPAADVTPPSVTSVIPAANATSVATNSTVSATFSESLNTSTVNTSSFTLKKGTASVSGSVSMSGNTAIFTPSAPLTGGTVYTATLSTAIKDASGNSLASTYTWNFTTANQADVTPPTVQSVVPLNNAASVATNSAVSATFSESMNSSTITTSTFTLKQGTTSVAGSVTSTATTATFTPSTALAAGTMYTATITTGVKDAAGNAMAAAYTWTFTTATQSDVTPPTVQTVVPSNGATSVATNSAVNVTFSESMSSSTITTSTFTLKQGTTSVSGSVSYSGTTATFTPSSVLAAGTVYTATITTGVKDAAGNSLASAYTWSFTTAAAATGMSFASDVVPVLTLCNNCHTHPWTVSSNPSTFYTNLVNQGYVNPTNYTTSKIYVKLSGGHPGSAISTTDINKILTWMKEGSKNN